MEGGQVTELLMAACFVVGLALGAWWACTPDRDKEVLAALADVPDLELEAWVSSQTATRFRRKVAKAELRRRGVRP
jgi:hypothetical protein